GSGGGRPASLAGPGGAVAAGGVRGARPRPALCKALVVRSAARPAEPRIRAGLRPGAARARRSPADAEAGHSEPRASPAGPAHRPFPSPDALARAAGRTDAVAHHALPLTAGTARGTP